MAYVKKPSKTIDDIPCKDSWRALDRDGYHVMHEATHGYRYEHRYVYAKHHKIGLTSKNIIRHKCDNAWCIEVTHLELGTQTDNVNDSIARGNHKSPRFPGESNPSAFLTAKHVRYIRKLWKTGKYSHKALSDKFEVTVPTIFKIVNGYTWKEIPSRD